MIYIGILDSISRGAALFLDAYPGAIQAFSLRKLRSAYNGSCIRVRRSSDNTEQNIGFLNGNLDVAALNTFVGAGIGYVTTWYDQSGNGYNLIQVNVSQQPYIISAGVVNSLNGKYAMLFTRVGQFSNLYSSAIWNTNMAVNSAIINVYALGNNDSLEAPIWSYPSYAYSKGSQYQSFGNNKIYTIVRNAANTTWYYSNAAVTYLQNQSLSFSTITGSATMQTWLNGASYLPAITVPGGILATTGDVMRLSNNPASSSTLMYQQELIAYSTTNQSANQTAMQTAINSYYTIY